MSSKIVQKNAADLPRFQDECLRGVFAALSGQKKTPCKSFAEGLFRDVTKMMNAAKVPRAADLPRSVFLQDRFDLALQLCGAVWWRLRKVLSAQKLVGRLACDIGNITKCY